MIKWKVASTLNKARTALLFYTSGFYTLNSSLWLLWLQRRNTLSFKLFSFKSNMSFAFKLWRFLFVLGFQTFNYDVSWHVFGFFLLEVHSTSWICRHGGLINAPIQKISMSNLGEPVNNALIWKWILSGKATWLAKGNLKEMPHINDSNSHEGTSLWVHPYVPIHGYYTISS